MKKKSILLPVLIVAIILLSFTGCMNNPVIPFLIEMIQVQGIQITQPQGEVIVVGIGNTDIEFKVKVNDAYAASSSIKVWAGIQDPIQVVAEISDLSNPAFWQNVDPGEYSVRLQIIGPDSNEANYYFVVRIERQLSLKKLLVDDKIVPADSVEIEIDPGETVVFAEYNDPNSDVDVFINSQKYTNPCTFTALPKETYVMRLHSQNSNEATENTYTIKVRSSGLSIVDILVDGIFVSKDSDNVDINEGITNVFAEANDDTAVIEFELNGIQLDTPRGGEMQFTAESGKKYTLKIKATKDITIVERTVQINVLQGISARVSNDSIVKVSENKSNPETLNFIINSENVDFVEAWLEFPVGHPNYGPNMKRIGVADVSQTNEAVFPLNPFDAQFMSGVPGKYILWAKTVEDQTFHASSTVNFYSADLTLGLEDVGFPDNEIYTTEEYHRFIVSGSLFPGKKARSASWELTLTDPDGNNVDPVPFTHSVTSGDISSEKEGTLTTYIPEQNEYPLFRLSENGLYTAVLSADCEFGPAEYNRSTEILIHYSGQDPLKIDNLLVNGIEIEEGMEVLEIKPGNTEIFADTNYSDSEISIEVSNYVENLSERTASTYKKFDALIGNKYEITVTATKNSQVTSRKVILDAKNGISMNLNKDFSIIVDESGKVTYPEKMTLSLYSANAGTVQVYLKLPQGHPKGQGMVGPVYEYLFTNDSGYATFNIDLFDTNYIDGHEGLYEYYAKPLNADFAASDTLGVMTAKINAGITDSAYVESTARGTETYHQFTINGSVFPGLLTESTSWKVKVLDPLGNHVQFLPFSGPTNGDVDETVQGTLTTYVKKDTKTGLLKLTESGTYTAILTVNGSFDDDTYAEATAQRQFFYESAPDLSFEDIFVSGTLLKETDQGTELTFNPGKVSIYAAANYNDAEIIMKLDEEELTASTRGKMFEFEAIAGKKYKVTLTASKGVTKRNFEFFIKIPRKISMTFNSNKVVILGDPKTQPEEVALSMYSLDNPNQIVEIWILPPADNPNFAQGRKKYFETSLNDTGNATLSLDLYENPFAGVEGEYSFYLRIAGQTEFQSSSKLNLYLPWATAVITDESGNGDTEYSSSAYHRFKIDAAVFPGTLAKDCDWRVEIAGANGGQAETVPLGGGSMSGKIDVTTEGTLTLKTAGNLESALLRLSQTDTYTATLTVEGIYNENDEYSVTDTIKIYYENEPPEATLTVLNPLNGVVNSKNELILLVEAFDQLALGDISCAVENGLKESEESYLSPDSTTYRATVTYSFENIDGATSSIDIKVFDRAGFEKDIHAELFVDVVAPRISQAAGSILFINSSPLATETDFITDFSIKEATIVVADADGLLESYETDISVTDISHYTANATFTAKAGVSEGNVIKTVIATDTADNCTERVFLLKVDTKGPEPITPITGMIVFGAGADYIQLPFHEQIMQDTLVATLTIGTLKYSIDNSETVYIPGFPYIYKTYYNCDLTTNPQPTIDIFVKDMYSNSSYRTNLPVTVQTNSSPEK